jgi:hypothetical protein
MWNALKSDLLDFVNTIQVDTTTVIEKVLGEEETEVIVFVLFFELHFIQIHFVGQ